jgi:hypothetical protein
MSLLIGEQREKNSGEVVLIWFDLILSYSVSAAVTCGYARK